MNINLHVIIDDQTVQNDKLNIVDIVTRDCMTVNEVKQLYSNDNVELYFIYRGMIFDDNTTLKDVGVIDGGCVKLVKRNVKAHQQKLPCNDDEMITRILKCLKEILKSQRKDVISKIILDEVKHVVDYNKELEDDFHAYCIASDPKLLRTLFSNRENVEKVLRKRRVLLPAALKTIEVIKDRVRHMASPAIVEQEGDARFYSLNEVEQSDSSSDDDDEPLSAGASSSASSQFSHQISRPQLREALSNVGGRGAFGGSSRPSSSHSSSRISLSQLRSAVQGALKNQPHEQQHHLMDVDEPCNSQSHSENTVGSDTELEQKMLQLEQMGFLDRKANKAALEAVGGDVEAAIEFLCG